MNEHKNNLNINFNICKFINVFLFKKFNHTGLDKQLKNHYFCIPVLTKPGWRNR